MKTIKSVYILSHIHEFENGYEDFKLIGVFLTESHALEILNKYKSLPGFKDHISGFSINEYTINRLGWTEGFVTLD